MGYVIGIIGSEGAKFTPETEVKARQIIRSLLDKSEVTGISSGARHLGGIDVWAEQIGKELGKDLFIYPPKTLGWSDGYKPRNLQIVAASDELHCITLEKLPESYTGMKFAFCYHCKSYNHVKSGGCWTVKEGQKLGKPGLWHIIKENV